ncbi:nitronate monooxygenase [bacterium]|nr:nitronate monooxygenase [bacterium]
MADWSKNRICTLLGTDLPIIQAGMIYNSGADLAAAAAEAGCLGIIGSGSMRTEFLRDEIRRARELTDKPIGVNIPLIHKHARANLEASLEEGVRLFVTSAGTPRKVAGLLRKAGAVFIHVVASAALAVKCEDAGCDAIVCEGFEAGGHNGREELTTMVLVPQCVDAVSIPVIAAGGIATGAQMAAALALGAEGVQIGSRFAVTKEASGHATFKQAVVDGDDTLLVMKKHMPVRLLDNAFREQVLALEAVGASREELSALLGEGRARRGMLDGDLIEGELEIGQVAALIDDVPSAREVVDRLVAGYDAAVERLT